MLKLIKKYLDYRLRKFCVKHAAKSKCGSHNSSETAVYLYEFITDKIYQDPHLRKIKGQERKT
jgi:hypothetical protein